jgi:hypothetical protein
VTTNGDRLTPPHGLPARELLAKHDSDISDLRRDAKAAADGIESLQTMMGGVMKELGTLTTDVEILGKDVRHAMKLATIPPPPLMRPELSSGVDLELFAQKVAEAALDGQARHDSTPEREVEKIVEVVTERQKNAAIVKAAKLRAAAARRVAEFVVGSLAVAYLLHLIETFHH